jgi:hypothetical protein
MPLDGFWVYENWAEPHVTIHRSSCNRCTDGKGHRRDREAGAWLWHGRFTLLGTAWWFAENRTVQGSREGGVKNCAYCLGDVLAPPEMLKVPPETA